MHRLLSRLAALAVVLVPLAGHAQVFRAYLSSTGVDNPACSRAAPCRLLPAALAAITPGGEIWILDSANFNSGPVTVGKSVTILAIPGAVGSLVSLSGAPVLDISSGGVRVTLRNIQIGPIAGAPTGHGIQVGSGSSLTVEKSAIQGLSGTGIVTTAMAFVRVVDSTFKDLGDGGISAIDGSTYVARTEFSNTVTFAVQAQAQIPDPEPAAVDLLDNSMENCGTGLHLSNAVGATLRASARGNRMARGGHGIRVFANGAGRIELTATGNLITNNAGNGIEANSANAPTSVVKVLVSANTVTSNTNGVVNSNALVESTGDNVVRNNTSSDSSGMTSAPKL